MSTIIKHYRNSFLDIENESIRVLMDPWLNTANEGSWAACKNGNNFIFNSINRKAIDFIYISHLHTDHFDIKFLIKLKKIQKKNFKIIIKKFKDGRFKNQLIKHGFTEKQIIDIKEFETFSLSKNSKIIILPQISSSNTPSHYIKYDLDTSCVFIDKNVRLYNQVDNPYTIDDIRSIIKKLGNKLSGIDLAFIPYCAASEFPQSFINLDRTQEMKNIKKIRIEKFLNVAKKIKCKNVIPAGGSYNLDSIFSKLNKFLAIPRFSEINSIYKKKKINKFNLINTNNFYFEAKKNQINLKKNNFSNHFISKIQKNKKNITYNNIKGKFSSKKIKKILNILEKSMPEFKKSLYNKTNTVIKFCVWDQHPVLINKLKNKKSLLEHEIQFSNQVKNKSVQLKIHVYYKLLLGIINKVVSWNEVQNHCLFERRPNKYDPDAIFWLNLYKF